MRTKQELDHLREQARSLRTQGKSRNQIKQAIDFWDNAMLTGWLQDLPTPEWTKRPNAKDALRDQARDLRRQGLKYTEIVAELGVSKSSVSLWVRDIPAPPALSLKIEEGKKRTAEGFRRYSAMKREIADTERKSTIATTAAEIGSLTDRELLIAGSIAYWCEGAKAKPHRPVEQVMFMNSAPRLITFFLRFLDAAEVPREDLIFRVYIHETADVAAAEQFWLDVTGASPDQFRSTVLKHHNPKTVRKNTGDDYHGCLRLDVRRSTELYRRIEGWATAAMSSSKVD